MRWKVAGTMCRYRLQRKEQHVFPNVLGNHYMPVYSYRWKDIAVCDEREPLEDMRAKCAPPEAYRVIDTLTGSEAAQKGENHEADFV